MVENAFKRYVQASAALEAQARRALADPLSDRWIQAGFIEPGDRRSVAVEKITTAFLDMQRYLRRSAILEMCAAFEAEFMSRIPTAIGEARSNVRSKYNIKFLSASREQLIREGSSFASIDSILLAIKAQLDEEEFKKLDLVRSARNLIAHGRSKISEDPHGISPELAREALALARSKFSS